MARQKAIFDEPKVEVLVKVVQGLAMIDPLTGTTYTTAPTLVRRPSSWVDTHLELGNLIRV